MKHGKIKCKRKTIKKQTKTRGKSGRATISFSLVSLLF